MKDKILRLCKRLNKFSLDEIVTITELEQEDVKYIIDELVSENKLIENDGQYKYNEILTIKQTPSIFQYYNSNIINLVIRCFCLDIPSYKTKFLVQIGEDQARKFYDIFRRLIYERQKSVLDNFYTINPQNARHRRFFEREVFLYFYDNQIFISKELLKSKRGETLNRKIKAKFTTVYCYLVRNLTHNKNSHNLEDKIAETLWRRNKDYNILYEDLTNLINKPQTLSVTKLAGFCIGGKHET